jgi:NAD(P)-dependent dehydrogenase (short-subunit alcohol dehydrogenase family)
MTPPHRVAVVTGGSSGIGAGIAEALAREGWQVVIIGKRRHRLDSTLTALRRASPAPTPHGHLGLALDVATERDMQAMAEQTLARYGRIDLLVASAGLGKRDDSKRMLPHPTAELPLEEWNTVIGVNLTGIFLSNRAVIPAMRAQGGGQIINIGSSTTPAGLRGTPYAPAYCASKFAMVGLTEAIAGEEERNGIRVQVVFPGPVDTPLVDQTALARPFGGAVSAEHFADAVVFLAEQPIDAVVVHPHILPFRGYFNARTDNPGTN